jgi:hypothetical protein
MATDGQTTARLQVADVLETFAAESGWNEELWHRFNDLLRVVEVDGLMANADEELIHYSGEFHARNLLGLKVKPDKIQVADYKEQFRALAAAIRDGTSWEGYKRQNNIYERGELSRAVIAWAKGLFRR